MTTIEHNDSAMDHLGSGVCIFRNAINLDWEWLYQTAKRLVDEDVADMYAPTVHPETGKPALINKSGYIYSDETFLGMPGRCTSAHQRKDAEIKNLASFTSVMSINVGNPHCVLLVKEIPQNWQEIGSKIENMTHIFPHKTNVEFVRELGNNAFEVLVWERGAGRTFACGTGACGVAFAMVKNGLADSKHPIEIYMEGSKIYGNGKAISVQLLENSILMTNHAFFEGRIDV